MAQVKSCKRCGSLFKSDVRIFCPPCRRIEEEEFRRVREYLRLNHDASLMELVIATEVDQKKILDYIRRGRLEVQKQDFGVIIKCEICGDPVSKGMLCHKCYQKMTTPVKKQEEKEPDNLENIRNKLIRRKSHEEMEHVFFRREDGKKEPEKEP